MIDLQSMSIATPTPDGTASIPPVGGDAPLASPRDAPGDSPAERGEAPPAEEAGTPGEAELDRLRHLLFSRELALLARLEQSHQDPHAAARRVGEVLAEAIQLHASDRRLGIAMEPVVDSIVKSSLKNRQNEFIGALSPLMGPTIRKSIAESFRSMMGDFSKSVEMAFSWKGLRWRLEALRSGKTFSEIIMLHTLVWRVEQLFFIHTKTGLVISHLAGESVESQDPDMVSAMLTAIQDFVRDCFAGGKDEDLHSLQLGDFTIHIESGSHAYMACVLRGTPPANFHEQMRTALDLFHVEFADPLATFDGDTGPFAGAVRFLDLCMTSRYVDEDRPLSLFAKVFPAALLLLFLAAGGYFHYTRREAAAELARTAEEARVRREAFTASMHAGLASLKAAPGLILTEIEEAPEPPWSVQILKDALGPEPEDVLRAHGTDPALFSIRVIPFMSYEPAIILQRVRRLIDPPETVAMHYDGAGTLRFTGTAPISWIVATAREAAGIPGIERVDLDGVRDPKMERIHEMVAEVEDTVVLFPLGRDTPSAADLPRLNKAVDTLVELEKLAAQMGFSASLTIYGHADTVGDARRNYEISQARARMVAGLLYAKGSGMPVTVYGMGSEYPSKQSGGRVEADPGNQASRRIELRVHLSLSPSAVPELLRRR